MFHIISADQSTVCTNKLYTDIHVYENNRVSMTVYEGDGDVSMTVSSLLACE